MHPSFFFFLISPPAKGHRCPEDADKRYNKRSKLYRDKLWALDWVGVPGEPGCGAAVFLTEDEGTTWYCCGGIIRSEVDEATTDKGKVDDRDLRKFFLTSVYDEQGTNWVKTDHKVSLDIALFKGYGQQAFGMKAFSSKRDGNASRMLLPIEFLTKTNVYRRSGQYPMVSAGYQLSLPLMPFDALGESLAGLSACYSDRWQDVSTPQPSVSAKEKLITYQRRPSGGSSGNIPKKKVLDKPPSSLPGSSRAGRSSRSRDTSQRRMDEESSEKTENDERIRRLQSQSLATRRFTQGEGSCDVNAEREDSRGDEARARGDGEDDENEGECGGGQDHMDCEKAAASGEVLGGNVGGSEMEDQEMEDEEMEDEEMKDEGQDVDVSAELTSKGRGKRTAESSPKRAAPKKQARRKAVQDARLALDAAASTPGEAGVESKSKARVRKTSQPRKPVRPSRHPKSNDSSDDAEGVAPRLLSIPDDDKPETKKPKAVNMTQCFFLEYDEDGKKRKDPPRVVIDVMQILPIPVGEITFNQRALNPTIGKKELFHCIAAKDGGPNATVSFKDLIPSNFKCFGDMTRREKKIALRLMIDKKVIATTRLVSPGKLNMSNLLDIMQWERYMMRLFNYIVFKSENKEGKEWKDGNFIDYEGLEKRFGVKAAEWDEERDKIPLEYVRRVPKRLGGEQEEKGVKGAGLNATAALYRDAPFHFKYFVYHAIGRVDLLTTELRRLKNAALNLSWEKKQRRSTLLPVNMQPKDLLPAGDEIVTAATNLNCKAAILDLANPKNCLVWTPADFDGLRKMMTKLCSNNWILIVFAPQKQHKAVMKQLYNWDDAEVLLGTWKRYLGFGTAVSKYGNWQVDYKDTMAVVLHAEGGDLSKVARAPKSEAEIVELTVDEEQFK
ncbi:hypothetical protein CBR_g57541 [Chara braunii]|uniref:Uncharacterized protein n=1 Tax=Chara braunii TaxID=69332 RepID=A0A388ME78_CHABU|nr:hypothetical protein CBR_g57541 [Chara braunii]|eukprot:GBG92861.1 hypothetical protein CBR_g57541 [Chara braunii]